MKIFLHNKYLFCFLGLLLGTSSFSQQSNMDEYLEKMRKIADSIKTAKTNNKNQKTTTGAKVPTVYSRSIYRTNKRTIENTYNQLTSEEKAQVKNLPDVPEAFRNNIDAQTFVQNLNNIDLNKLIAASSSAKKIALTGYYASYISLKKKAEQIVRESEKLRTAFLKLNPSIIFGNNVGKTYVSENGLVYLPLGDASFADEVTEAKYYSGNLKFSTDNCLGTPNYIEGKKIEDNKGIYSLGLKGSLTVKLINNALVDVNGPDLFVFEAGEIEPTNLEISKDGTIWLSVGTISGGTAAVDISKVSKPGEYYYYVRLTDLNTKSTIAGADIDAVATIGAAIKLSLNAEVLFDLGKAELKADGIVAIKKLATQLQSLNNAVVTIEGHTDDIGNDDANNKLSLQRAQAVSKILKQELKSKIQFVYKEIGKGKTEPAVPNTNDENRKKNRRVEILVIPH